MSITDTLNSSEGFRPLNRVRDLLHLTQPVRAANANEADLPQSPRNRHEALIHAARTALGGTVEW